MIGHSVYAKAHGISNEMNKTTVIKDPILWRKQQVSKHILLDAWSHGGKKAD